jgi:VanZ family protein
MTVTPNIFRWLLVLALLICSYGFLKDVSDLPSNLMPNDKVMHLVIFMVLTLLWQLSFDGKTLTGLAIMAAYGGAIELLQHYFTVRTGDWWDWVADLSGILVALICWTLLPEKYKPFQAKPEMC